MMKIAITGGTGLVGSRVLQLLKNEFEFIPLTSKDLDITNKEAVQHKLHDLDFDLFLHLAAYTQVDKAETEKEAAWNLNVNATKYLLQATQKKNTKFIYISTGFVFDGKNPPYYEDSVPNPVGEYGRTKYEGEKVVGKNGMIVRFEYPYGNSPASKKDFARTIKSLLEQGKELKMVTDSLMTPTFIDDIAVGLKYLILHYSPEIFHLVGSSALSPFDAGKIIAKTFKLDEKLIKPITFHEYFEGKAQRPQWAEVKSNKNTFFQMLSFDEGVAQLKI